MSPIRSSSTFSVERLAYWYFRLNGFLTTENFIIHPDNGTDQRTDADLLAIRFAHRAENLNRPMEDDPRVVSCQTFANVVIAEVTTGSCKMNGPWTNPNQGNMKRVLKAVGCVPENAIDVACDSLYNRGLWSDAMVTVRLFALGESKDNSLPIPPSEQQITWDEVISFCVKRFKDYQLEKSSVGQWTNDGRNLRDGAVSRTPEVIIRRTFRLRPKQDISGGA